MEENPLSPEVRAYMSALGRKKSPAKIEAQKENLAKGAASRRKNPLDLPCICKGGESLKASEHVTTCPRGRLLWQRERAAATKKQKEVAA